MPIRSSPSKFEIYDILIDPIRYRNYYILTGVVGFDLWASEEENEGIQCTGRQYKWRIGGFVISKATCRVSNGYQSKSFHETLNTMNALMPFSILSTNVSTSRFFTKGQKDHFRYGMAKTCAMKTEDYATLSTVPRKLRQKYDKMDCCTRSRRSQEGTDCTFGCECYTVLKRT